MQLSASLTACAAIRCVVAIVIIALYVPSVARADSGVRNRLLPQSIISVMHKPRYVRATWTLLAADLATNETLYALDPERLAFTGSVRKLFSVGVALSALGANHRFVTPVYRRGTVGHDGTLRGDLVLVASGDLTFGGRLQSHDAIAFTDFDHNDANSLGTAILTPQDPLLGLNELARQVRATGLRSVRGDVVIDDRLFDSYRVPNGNLLITPMLVNENIVDVWGTPAAPGETTRTGWRPQTSGLRVVDSVRTAAAGTKAVITLSPNENALCDWPKPCTRTIFGTIPVDYSAPLSGVSTFVRTFRVEQPASFARIAFIDALTRAGVSVSAPLMAKNRPSRLPPIGSKPSNTLVARFVSPPYAQAAKLVLKVSLNLGANLSLSLFGLTQGKRTVAGSLAAERTALVKNFGIPPGQFDFPTNGSGSPDSRATARAVVTMLETMSRNANAATYRAALPIFGVDGSLATIGRSLPVRGHAYAKTGTSIDATGLKAQVLAGYIDTKRGHHLAFSLFVNNVGPLDSIADVAAVLGDQAEIVNAIYDAN